MVYQYNKVPAMRSDFCYIGDYIITGPNSGHRHVAKTGRQENAEQSGDATATLNDYDYFQKIKTIEIYEYGAWKKEKNEAVEGTISEKQTFDISEVPVQTIKD